jgi:hypothetical protein
VLKDLKMQFNFIMRLVKVALLFGLVTNRAVASPEVEQDFQIFRAQLIRFIAAQRAFEEPYAQRIAAQDAARQPDEPRAQIIVSQAAFFQNQLARMRWDDDLSNIALGDDRQDAAVREYITTRYAWMVRYYEAAQRIVHPVPAGADPHLIYALLEPISILENVVNRPGPGFQLEAVRQCNGAMLNWRK